jgi:hypothetical protein
MNSKLITLPEARRQIQLKYPALCFTVLPKAVEELGLTIETQEVKCLAVEDFEKLTEYLDSSEVRERLQRLSLRSKS